MFVLFVEVFPKKREKALKNAQRLGFFRNFLEKKARKELFEKND